MELAALISLYRAHPHSHVRVRSISGGWEIRRRVRQSGIRAGDRLQVLRRAPFGGPLLVARGSLHLAVGRQLAEKIEVKILE